MTPWGFFKDHLDFLDFPLTSSVTVVTEQTGARENDVSRRKRSWYQCNKSVASPFKGFTFQTPVAVVLGGGGSLIRKYRTSHACFLGSSSLSVWHFLVSTEPSSGPEL